MANDSSSDPLADVINLLATPLAGTLRSVEQFRKGVDEFLAGVENFNRTVGNVNETSERINALLIDIEAPLRAAVPQLTRTIKGADEVVQAVAMPAIALAPGLAVLARTLNSPEFAQLPKRLEQFSEVVGDMSRRLGPLTTLAESAGGFLGGLRPSAAMPSRSPSPSPTESGAPSTEPAPKKPAPKRSVASKASTKSSAAKKKPAKKKPVKQNTAKKAPAKRKSTARKASTKSPK
ncbi:MAG: hypothetical protein KUG57_00075 [Ilumatobacteraceae bacterium]|nr:hypothetical protein [Ilumatobacteraceae bacterium]